VKWTPDCQVCGNVGCVAVPAKDELSAPDTHKWCFCAHASMAREIRGGGYPGQLTAEAFTRWPETRAKRVFAWQSQRWDQHRARLKVQGYTALGQLEGEFAAGSEAEREQMLRRLDAQQAVDRVKAAERGRSPRGSLRNGNQPGDPSVAPRCGARAKTRGGKPCRAPAMPNGRCRLHGGLSTGPKTGTSWEQEATRRKLLAQNFKGSAVRLS
jgi:hypothetical protein